MVRNDQKIAEEKRSSRSDEVSKENSIADPFQSIDERKTEQGMKQSGSSRE
ncbi:MAG: hypothetical protein HFI14_03870 [Lachnospiraceae bacterium]|nr:hypothetical protein [Lachnospiraceae bacterium]